MGNRFICLALVTVIMRHHSLGTVIRGPYSPASHQKWWLKNKWQAPQHLTADSESSGRNGFMKCLLHAPLTRRNPTAVILPGRWWERGRRTMAGRHPGGDPRLQEHSITTPAIVPLCRISCLSYCSSWSFRGIFIFPNQRIRYQNSNELWFLVNLT